MVLLNRFLALKKRILKEKGDQIYLCTSTQKTIIIHKITKLSIYENKDQKIHKKTRGGRRNLDQRLKVVKSKEEREEKKKSINYFSCFFGSGVLMLRKREGEVGVERKKKWQRRVIAERSERVGLHLMVAENGVIAIHTPRGKKKLQVLYIY